MKKIIAIGLAVSVLLTSTSVFAGEKNIKSESCKVQSTTNLSSQIMPRTGYTRTEKPALGKASDYPVNQGTTKRNVAFGGFIRNLGELDVATGISVYTGSTGLGVAASIVTAAVNIQATPKLRI